MVGWQREIRSVSKIYLVMLILIFAMPAIANHGSPKMPRLTGADLPIYPDSARIAGVSGKVAVTIVTDGYGVIDTKKPQGPPLLVSYVIQNVKTWKFRPHKPLDFHVEFLFELTMSESEDDSIQEVICSLPQRIIIKTNRIKHVDPVVRTRND